MTSTQRSTLALSRAVQRFAAAGPEMLEAYWRALAPLRELQQRTDAGGNDTTNPRDTSETNRTRIV